MTQPDRPIVHPGVLQLVVADDGSFEPNSVILVINSLAEALHSALARITALEADQKAEDRADDESARRTLFGQG